jgi:hypothetical protein
MPTSPAPAEGPASPRGDAQPEASAIRRPRPTLARLVPLAAIVSIAALALLVPTAPLLGLLLVAAILGSVVAVLLRRSRLDRDERTTLDDLAAAGYVVLHDRAAPGFAGTVRRLLIGPGGVFLVDMVDVAGRVRVRGDAVVVGSRSLALGPRLQGQLRAVSQALAPQLAVMDVRVTPLICMRRAELPLLRRSVAGIPLLREARAARRIAGSPTILDEASVALVAELARSTMPPVGRSARDQEARNGERRRAPRPGTARSRVDGSDALTEAPSPA